MSDIDYWVSKIKWDENQTYIISMMVHENNNGHVTAGEEKNRNWIVQKLNNVYKFYCIALSEDNIWNIGNEIYYDSGIKGFGKLPLIQAKRKTFVSYYHNDDSKYKKKFLNLTQDLIVSKSVEDGDISSDVSDEYVKQLIQKEYLYDTTVLIVLIGAKTKCRKHVDWEISGALNFKVGDSYAGILGILLPTHPDYGSGKCTYNLIPARLADNFKSKYAVICDYTTDRPKLQEYIELAYKNRKIQASNKINSRIQMQRDTCR